MGGVLFFDRNYKSNRPGMEYIIKIIISRDDGKVKYICVEECMYL